MELTAESTRATIAGMLGRVICWMLVAMTPMWVAAEDAVGIVHTTGVVLRNGAEMQINSSDLFPGDLLETKAGSIATIDATGTNVHILPTSLVEFQGPSLSLEHGAVSVATSHGVSVRVSCMTIVPVSAAWTQYEVINVNGSIEVTAKKNDVTLNVLSHGKVPKHISAAGTGSLREGEETTRYESDGCEVLKTKKETGAVPSATGGLLNSEYAKWFAIGGIGAAGAFAAVQSDDPISPFIP